MFVITLHLLYRLTKKTWCLCSCNKIKKKNCNKYFSWSWKQCPFFQGAKIRFTMLFELGGAERSAVVSRPTMPDLRRCALAQLALYVASTGQTLNIADGQAWLGAGGAGPADSVGQETKTILCMPIVNGQKDVIGVAQLINKVNTFFETLKYAGGPQRPVPRAAVTIFANQNKNFNNSIPEDR